MRLSKKRRQSAQWVADGDSWGAGLALAAGGTSNLGLIDAGSTEFFGTGDTITVVRIVGDIVVRNDSGASLADVVMGFSKVPVIGGTNTYRSLVSLGDMDAGDFLFLAGTLLNPTSMYGCYKHWHVDVRVGRRIQLGTEALAYQRREILGAATTTWFSAFRMLVSED